MVHDAAWASLVGSLYGGVILVGFALELDASPFVIGLLTAIPFLAQLAQFSALEQSRQLSQNTSDLLGMNASTQAVSLLNRQIEMSGVGGIVKTGTVIAVQFGTEGPELSIRDSTGSVTPGVRLSQVTLIKP